MLEGNRNRSAHLLVDSRICYPAQFNIVNLSRFVEKIPWEFALELTALVESVD